MEIKLKKDSATLGNFGIEIEMISPITAVALAELLSIAGIETRAEGYNHITRPTWKIVSDSSIRSNMTNYRGFELVSPILNGENGLAQIKAVCAVLKENGCKVNVTCGLHVHHEAGAFGPQEIEKMIRYYKKAEVVIDSMMAASRRGNGNNFCRSMLPLDEKSIPGNRYYKVNFESIGRHGTVEFRQHGGTVEAENIISWVLLTCMILHKIKNGGKVISPKPFENWLDFKWDLGLSFKGEKNAHAEKMVAFYYKRIKALEGA